MSKLTDVRCPKCNHDMRPRYDGHDTWVECDRCGFDSLYSSGRATRSNDTDILDIAIGVAAGNLLSSAIESAFNSDDSSSSFDSSSNSDWSGGGGDFSGGGSSGEY